MKYYKNIDNGFIASISSGAGETEITESEYNEIMTVIQNAPTAPDGYAYKLRTDLTWELVEIPPEPYVPTTEDKAEGFDILIGVSE